MKAFRLFARILAVVLIFGSAVMVVVTRPWIGLVNADVPSPFHWTDLVSFAPSLILAWSCGAVLLLLAKIDERLEHLQLGKNM